ncbi:MAG: glycosyltransferase family 87 protein [Terriglobia bacterium]|nr:glycosyltransferase family 87 protein [Terriglobia bacterium]
MRQHLPKLLVAIAFLFFLVRGPLRAIHSTGYNDFAGSFTIAHVWLRGLNCYSPSVVVDQWVKDGRPALEFVLRAAKDTSMGGSGTGLPPCIPFIAPFTLLPALVADQVWIWFTGAIVFAMLLLLFRSRNLLFLALALSLANLHTGIKGGNASTLVIACLGFSYLWRFERPIFAGILLGIAGCFKPHLAGAGLLFFIFERTWGPVMVSVLTGLAATAMFALRLEFTAIGSSWIPELLTRTVAIGYTGGPDDFSLANPARYELVNLQVILGSVLSDRAVINTIAIGIVVVLVALWAYWMIRREVSPLLGFAAINVILLLPSYHRINDAGVIVFAVAAAATMRYGWAIAVAFIPFIAPVPSAIMRFIATGRLPASLLQNKPFIVLVLCHEIWIILAVALFLLAKMQKSPGRSYREKDEAVVIDGVSSGAQSQASA